MPLVLTHSTFTLSDAPRVGHNLTIRLMEGATREIFRSNPQLTSSAPEAFFDYFDPIGVIALPGLDPGIDRAIQYPAVGGYWIARSGRAMTAQ